MKRSENTITLTKNYLEKRIGAIATLFLCLLIAACSGGSRESGELEPSDLAPQISVTIREAGYAYVVVVIKRQGSFMGANVQLTDGDRLYASIGGTSTALHREGEGASHVYYDTSINTNGLQGPITVTLERTDGERINTIQNIPPSFTIMTPSTDDIISEGSDMSLTWSPNWSSGHMNIEGTLRCRVRGDDGTRSEVVNRTLGVSDTGQMNFPLEYFVANMRNTLSASNHDAIDDSEGFCVLDLTMRRETSSSNLRHYGSESTFFSQQVRTANGVFIVISP